MPDAIELIYAAAMGVWLAVGVRLIAEFFDRYIGD